ncbi:hypothetical protein NYO91_09315 [Arhodomonas aquaeolei]|uniref:hypothetical protein n=1 Tax=Arhodomonas aquaeolei TaxID=2369 RepID=UPI00216A740C|nr:hypothetical protein [Arhodomonas aquaeolei]MCS4504274.1 hypothetical protein [Arhodomonas aquaeolei]
MLLTGLVKMITTAVVIIAVTLSVARLGPRLGGVIAGTPIVLGPAFFFLGLERPPAFLADAAVATLHALTATLVFLVAYVLAAARLGPVASLATAVAAWVAAAAAFATIPGGWVVGLAAYAALFALASAIRRRLDLPRPRVRAPTRRLDLLVRGLAGGVLVGVVTTVAAEAGPQVAGTLTGFPVGFTMISLTLHQRFGPAVARATLATAQGGMLSLVAFASVEAATAPVAGGMGAFALAFAASVTVSMALLAAGHRSERRRSGTSG